MKQAHENTLMLIYIIIIITINIVIRIIVYCRLFFGTPCIIFIYLYLFEGVLPWGRPACAHQYQQPQQEGNGKEIFKKKG